jgi:acetyl-CoA synthetase
MKKLTDYTSYADAQAHWSPEKLWDLFDGGEIATRLTMKRLR